MAQPPKGSKEEELIREGSGPTAKNKKPHVPLTAIGLIVFIIEFAVFWILFYMTPAPNIITIGLDYLFKNIQENYIGASINIFWIVLVSVSAIVAIRALLIYKIDIGRLVSNLGMLFLVFDIMMAAGLGIYYTLLNFSILDPILCTSNLFTISKISPELTQRCIQYQQSQLPKYNKDGTATPLTIEFGYEVQGQTVQPVLYNGLVFSLPIKLKNIDEKEDLVGVVVKGYIQNDTCFPGSDCVNMVSTGTCIEENPCTIKAGRDLTVGLQSDQPVSEKVGHFVTIPVEVSYTKSAYGKSEFTVVRSYQDLAALDMTEPYSKTGPLDVVIYFAPDYYLAQSQGYQPSGTKANQLMYVAIANNGKGIGKIQNIIIERIGTFAPIEKVQCPIPWKTTDSIVEGSPFDLQDIPIPKGSNVQFACPIKIDNSIAGTLLNNFEDSSKGIPFTSSANYKYFETSVYEPPKPVLKLID